MKTPSPHLVVVTLKPNKVDYGCSTFFVLATRSFVVSFASLIRHVITHHNSSSLGHLNDVRCNDCTLQDYVSPHSIAKRTPNNKIHSHFYDATGGTFYSQSIICRCCLTQMVQDDGIQNSLPISQKQRENMSENLFEDDPQHIAMYSVQVRLWIFQHGKLYHPTRSVIHCQFR